MEKLIKLIKYFPLMPGEKETGKLILAIAFYLIVPGIVATIVGVILFPVAMIIGLLGSFYMVWGITFSFLSYMGKNVTQIVTDALTPNKTEE